MDDSCLKEFVVTYGNQKLIFTYDSFENFVQKCKESFGISQQSSIVFCLSIGGEDIQLHNDAIANQRHHALLVVKEVESERRPDTDKTNKGREEENTAIDEDVTEEITAIDKSINVAEQRETEEATAVDEGGSEENTAVDGGETGENTAIDEGACNKDKSPCHTATDECTQRPTLTDYTNVHSSGFADIIDSPDDVTPRPTDVTGSSDEVTSDPADVTSSSDEVTSDPADVTGSSDEVTFDPADVTGSSDEVSAYDLVDDEDMRQHLLQFGLKDIDATLKKAFEKQKHNFLNIAIIGQSGTGKSSLINALMMLRRGDKGAAVVGEGDETTMECKYYKHPKYPNVLFWDVPGMETESFPKETYMEDIKVERYDFLLLTYTGRLERSDIWLKNELEKLQKKCYLVYTKTDNDIDCLTRSNSELNEEKLLLHLRSKVMYKIKKSFKDFTPTCFLISSLHTNSFDFTKLSEKLIDDAPKGKELIVLYTVGASSKKIIELKAQALRKRIWPVVLLQTLKSVTHFPTKYGLFTDLDFIFDGLDAKYIMKEIKEYMDQFGLTVDNLNKIAKDRNISLTDLTSKVTLKSALYNADGLKSLYLHSKYTILKKMPECREQSFIKTDFETTEARKCESFLEMILDNMRDDALKILEFCIKNPCISH